MTMLRTASVAELAELVNAQIIGDGAKTISGVATLQSSGENDISFLSNTKYKKFLKETKAGAVLIAPEVVDDCPVTAIVCDNPYLAYATITEHLLGEGKPTPGIHPTAVVSDSATVSSSARIDAFVTIGENTVIEAGVWIGANSSVGANCVIGEDTRLFPNVSFYDHVTVGKDCQFHSGAVIGADGFGIAKDGRQWVRIPQIGGVEIGDRVDVGANTTIDSGALEPTVIEDGVKLDNQVHIAHNCRVGENTAFAGKAAMAGSATIGKDCTVGGGTAINGHINVCDNVHFTGYAMVSKSISEPGVYSSVIPAQENTQWRKTVVLLRQLEKMQQRLKNLEAQIAKFELED